MLTRLLFVAWLLSLGTSLLIDANLLRDQPPLKLWLRLGSSIILVVSGIYFAWQAPSRWKLVAWLVVLGMLLGFLGDSTMASILGKEWFPNRVIGGMVFFGLGHLAYIAATELSRRQLHLQWNSTWWLAIILWQLIGLGIWYGMAYLGDKQQALHLPALGYCSLLAATAGITAGLALAYRPAWLIALGAALFLLSDALLAWQIFRESNAYVSFLVWATYGPGQMLIVFGFHHMIRRQSNPTG